MLEEPRRFKSYIELPWWNYKINITLQVLENKPAQNFLHWQVIIIGSDKKNSRAHSQN